MELAPVNDTSKAPAERFTGDVYVTSIHRAQPPSHLVVALVRFTPGARTNWHSHALEGVEDGDGTTWLDPVTDEQYAAADRPARQPKPDKRRFSCTNAPSVRACASPRSAWAAWARLRATAPNPGDRDTMTAVQRGAVDARVQGNRYDDRHMALWVAERRRGAR
jgi:hypothetical protein